VELFRQVGTARGWRLALSLRSYLIFRHNNFFPADPQSGTKDAVRDQEESFAIAKNFNNLWG